jgi:hypothetical protein
MPKTISRRSFLRLEWLRCNDGEDGSNESDGAGDEDSLDNHFTDGSPTDRRRAHSERRRRETDPKSSVDAVSSD